MLYQEFAHNISFTFHHTKFVDYQNRHQIKDVYYTQQLIHSNLGSILAQYTVYVPLLTYISSDLNLVPPLGKVSFKSFRFIITMYTVQS